MSSDRDDEEEEEMKNREEKELIKKKWDDTTSRVIMLTMIIILRLPEKMMTMRNIQRTKMIERNIMNKNQHITKKNQLK